MPLTMEAVPFRLDIGQHVLEDVRFRLKNRRHPPTFIPGEGNYGVDSVVHIAPSNALEQENNTWAYGIDRKFLDDLLDYFENSFIDKWQGIQEELNQISQFTMEVEPGYKLHYIHEKCGRHDAIPLILCHGWPSTCYDFVKMVPKLISLGFDVVVPDICGFGFSTSENIEVTPKKMAHLYNKLMTQGLGYSHYVAQGGDWGAAIVSFMAQEHGNHCCAIHLNSPFPSFPAKPSLITLNKVIRAAGYFGLPDLTLNAREAVLAKRLLQVVKQHSAYFLQHITKPDTLIGLNDSIAGLVAYIAEKYFFAVDAGHVGGDIFKVISRDELLTTILIYWSTNTIVSSARFYRHAILSDDMQDQATYINVPTGVAAFQKEILAVPRGLVELSFDVQYYKVLHQGGHFAPMEQPDVLSDDIARFVRKVNFRKCAEQARRRHPGVQDPMPTSKFLQYSAPLLPVPFITYKLGKFLISKL